MKKIMILGGGSNQIGLLKTAKSCGYRVVLCDKNEKCLGRELSDTFYPVDIIDVKAIEQIASTENIDGIISNSEVVMEVIAEVSTSLGLTGNSKESIMTLNSKMEFRKFQHDTGLFAPQQIVISNPISTREELDGFQYPIIIKPVKCSGTRGTTRIDEFNLDSINEAIIECIKYSRDKACAIEEFIQMPSLTVLEGDIFLNKGKIIWDGLFFTRRSEKLPMVPMTYMSPYDDSDVHMWRIKNDLTTIFKNLGIVHGEYNVEAYFDKQDEFFVIEINARQGGHGLPAFVKLATGIDMDKLLVTTAVNEELYFNYICDNKAQQRYATRHAVFSDYSGTYLGLSVSDEIQNFVVSIEEEKKINEHVEKRINGSSVIGFVNLVFDSFEQQHFYSENIEKYIYPIIKRKEKIENG